VPEFPDLTLYLDALGKRVKGRVLKGTRLGSPFVLRTVEPPLGSTAGRPLVGLRRLGKQLVFELEGELFLVIHLMISGRLQWKPPNAKLPGRAGLVAFDFDNGTLILTEVSTKKRASLRVVQGTSGLRALDRGGLEVMTAHVDAFAEVLRRENHTVKRSLTDPRLFAAIGNAYSDEILHRAKMSPVKLTRALTGEEIARLAAATQTVLREWADRLIAQTGEAWPEKVTAFRPEMAVHGRYGQPCPVCGAKVQRIVHAENESNYCARCQTGGKLLADRSLSKLLKDDWPRTLTELEETLATRSATR
jgi:formamidopyrimidine-DNA glycosylase